MEMAWESPFAGLVPDVVLGADLLYDPGAPLSTCVEIGTPRASGSTRQTCCYVCCDFTLLLFRAEVVPTIVLLLAELLGASRRQRPAAVAYFATQLRAGSSMARFLDAAAAAGLRVEELDFAPDVVFHHLITEEDADSVLLHRMTASSI